MYLELLKTFNNIVLKEYNQAIFNEPVSTQELNKFIKESQLALQYTPNDEYIELLKLTNGFEWNGLSFYGVSEYFEMNIDFRELCKDRRNIIVLGHDDSTLGFTHNTNDKSYNVVMPSCLDEILVTYKSFSDLILGALNENDREVFNQANVRS